MNAVDTNVLVYFVDADEPAKQAKAVELMDRLDASKAQTVLPWQVAVEFLSCLRRWENAGRIVRNQTSRHLKQMESTFSFVFPSQITLAASLDLSSRYSLSHWDSMLIAACIEAGIQTLYSEDFDSGMTYDSVRVENPFV